MGAADGAKAASSPLILSVIHMVMHSSVEKLEVLVVENYFSLEIKRFQARDDMETRVWM
ncbi:hypothetical protein SLW73_18065 [Glutamicibacter protophormiae]|uniref:hypothetical protein n=1 Tax=Glutamicibacter protophormiae TaxID=37930 RepID=UPI002A7EDECB|nr:hypothetical protein [Glutamicibacter protophormiae]WPR64764.1 hypothetical protein SLW72_18070 [Glutamicibacter protophormiae]WPR68260.1 hypothetical protein SLW73_18065 [Glutamicibacter protophormiae]